jgi:hypothetical protein
MSPSVCDNDSDQINHLPAERCRWRFATWVFCDRCGCSVDTDLIHADSHYYSADGTFLCADCRSLSTGM